MCDLGLPNGTIDHRVPKGHRSEDDVTTIINGRPPLPPPNHPPPPPPTQIVKVDLKDTNGSGMWTFSDFIIISILFSLMYQGIVEI